MAIVLYISPAKVKSSACSTLLSSASSRMDHPTSSMPTLNPTDDHLLEEIKKYSDSVRVAALVTGIPIIIFGFLGNLMTIVAVIKTKALRTGANIFIISLSVFDLMYVTIAIPTIVTFIWNNGRVFSDIYCTTFPVLATLAIGGNLMNLSKRCFLFCFSICLIIRIQE